MWDRFGWLLTTGENPACLCADGNGLVRRGESEWQTAGKLQHKRDRQEPQEHSHVLCMEHVSGKAVQAQAEVGEWLLLAVRAYGS